MSYIAADEVDAIQVDTGDIGAIIDACEQLTLTYDIVGSTTVSEVFCPMAAMVCRHFGLPGPDPEAIKRCQDKFVQRQLLTKSGIPTPAYRLARDAVAAIKAAAEVGLPVIVKPVTGRGSSGVKLCRDLNEVAEHTDFLLAGKHGLPPLPNVLVEEFARGSFYTVSTIGSEVAAISAADFSELPYFTMRQFTFPAHLTSDENDRVVAVALQSLQALGLGWGPVNTEIRITSRGPVVIEVNPRIVGAPEPELIRLAHGIDLYAEALKPFLDLQPDLRKTRSHAAAARWLMVEQNGLLQEISGEREARAIPGITDVELKVEAGTPLVWHGSFQDVIGHVFAASPSPGRTDAALRQALDLIKLSVVPFPKRKDKEQLANVE
ncbi:ATP-grasp domain-containing protein [Pelagibius litoralis]|nr:ATP-grasp domain-containing protein [Pelagibius litoralis]